MQVRAGMIASIALLSMSTAGPSAGRSCLGDCNGDGEVVISELVLAVAIALEAAPVDRCPAIGPAPVGIDKVVASVNNALCGCGPCPTPPPTRTPTAATASTPTATPTRKPTPTATPEPPVLQSVWREDHARFGNSSCAKEINTAIRESLGAVSCPLDVTRQGTWVEVVDCNGSSYDGTIDSSGLFRGETAVEEDAGACSVTVRFEIAANLKRSPATANYTVFVEFYGACGGLRDCQLTATTRWTRVSGTIASTSARTAARGVAGTLVPSVLGVHASMTSNAGDGPDRDVGAEH